MLHLFFLNDVEKIELNPYSQEELQISSKYDVEKSLAKYNFRYTNEF